MRLLLSMLCLLLVASVASATHPVQIRAVVVQRQYVAPVVQQFAVDDCPQAFAVQQFYAAPVQFQRVQAFQSYGYGVQQQVQAVRVQRVQAVQVQRVQQVQSIQTRQTIRTRTVIR